MLFLNLNLSKVLRSEKNSDNRHFNGTAGFVCDVRGGRWGTRPNQRKLSYLRAVLDRRLSSANHRSDDLTIADHARVTQEARMPKRVDDNHSEIVAGLRSVGAEVQSLAAVGKGCVDALVAYRGVWYTGEIKDGSKPPSKRALTDEERKWHQKFSRQAPVHVWTSLDEALRTIGAIT